MPEFLKHCNDQCKYRLALRGTFANHDDQTSRFWVFHFRLKLSLSFNVEFAIISTRIVVETIVYEVGDAALGNANVDSEKSFWEVEANEG
jgi:hypothetical protein